MRKEEEFMAKSFFPGEGAQVVDHLLDRAEGDGVDVRARGRPEGGEVGPAERHGDDVVGEDVEELLGDVVVADGVLEGEVELVVALHVAVALTLVLARAVVRPALAVDVNGHVAPEMRWKFGSV